MFEEWEPHTLTKAYADKEQKNVSRGNVFIKESTKEKVFAGSPLASGFKI